MGLQKYRADKAGETQTDGATPWFANWMGGPSLSLIRDCPTAWGKRTVYITGEADTWFSIPAATRCKGRTIRGYVTTEERNGQAEWTFRPYTKELETLP